MDSSCPARLGSPYLLTIVILLSLLGWLAPIHLGPWNSFYNEIFYFTLIIVLISPIIRIITESDKISKLSSFLCFISILPVLQWLWTITLFIEDALTSSVYLLTCCISVFCGHRAHKERGMQSVFVFSRVLLIGCLLSLLLAVQQWSGTSFLGIWLTDFHTGDRPYANLAQPNNLATLFLLGVASVLYLRSRHRLPQPVFWTLALLLFAGVAMTRSRAALVTGAVLVLFICLGSARASLKLSPRQIALGGTAYFALWFWWPTLSAWVGVAAPARLEDAFSGGVRWTIWRELLGALWLQPWTGYGWGQVALAQTTVAAQYPHAEFVTYAHNILLDLLLWNGIPLGLALIVAGAIWLVRAIRDTRTPETWLGIACLLVVGTHAMFEFPHAYAYFLIPVGLALGMGEAARANAATVSVPVWAVRAVAIIYAALCIALFFNYLQIQHAFREARFHTAGFAVEAQPPAHNGYLLTKTSARIDVALMDVTSHMPAADMAKMAAVAAHYPTTFALYKYALALGVNGRPEDAAHQLRILEKLHSQHKYEGTLEALHLKAAEFPQLLAIAPVRDWSQRQKAGAAVPVTE